MALDERGGERVVGARRRASSRGRGPRRARASAPPRARARRSGRAGRGRGCRARSRSAASCAAMAGQRRLVALEQPELGRCRLAHGERRGDAGGEVGARAVARELHAPAQHLGEQRAGRRLAVRGRHEHAAARQPRGEAPRRVGGERRQHAARAASCRRPAARARRERRCAGRGECQPHHRRSPSTPGSVCGRVAAAVRPRAGRQRVYSPAVAPRP